MDLYRVDPRSDVGRVRDFLARSDRDDYLLEGLEEWVRDGRLWALEEHGEWVAFGRLHDLGDGEGWVSGVRVTADRRGKGLGRELVHGILSDARGVGITALRAVIEEKNVASRRLFERSGFRSVADLTLRRGRARTGLPGRLHRADPGTSLDGRVGWVAERTGRVDLLPGEDAGRFGRWRPALVDRWVREGKLYVGPGVAVAVQEDWWTEPRTLWVNPLQGEVRVLVPALDALTAALAHEEWQAFLPTTDELRALYDQAGLLPHPYWGDRVRLYERVEPGSPPGETPP